MATYRPKGVCADLVEFTINDDGAVSGVRFEGGCDGNSQGIARLAEGMYAKDIISRLTGIRCDGKSTSCPDQLAIALKTHLAGQ
jgi:uncharacterized protein (TIGR03905 family)